MTLQAKRTDAVARDEQDALAAYRDEFYLQPGSIYMDGNSLGLLSKRAEKTLLESLSDWKELGIDGWMKGRHPWFELSERLAALNAPLVRRPSISINSSQHSFNQQKDETRF